MTVLRPTRFLLLVGMTGCTGLRQSPSDAPAADVAHAQDSDALHDATDVPRDGHEATDALDATAMDDALDATAMDAALDATAMDDALDATAMDAALDATAMDAADSAEVTARDVAGPDVVDVPAAADVDPGALIAPRLRAPLAGTWMSTGRVTFRWLPVPGQDAVVEVCPDARCTTVARVLQGAPDGTASPSTDLAQGTWWWRVRPVVRGVRGLTPSATWHLVVEGRGAAPASATGLLLDPDADGRRDLYVGAWHASMGAGEVRVWIRTADLAPGLQRTLGPITRRGAGWAIAPAGDLDGDGLPEVAYSVMTSPNENGEVVLIRGDRSGNQLTMTVLSTGADDLTYGAAIAGLGDVDGDGFGDFAVARPSYFNNQDGTVFVYSGAAGGLRGWDGTGRALPSTTLRGASTQDNGFGRSLAGVGDLDGDGYADLVVGAPPRGTVTPGEVCVHLGGPAGLAATPTRIPAPQALPAIFGSTVAGAGDLNGDGLADFAASGGTRADPLVYVFYGARAGPRTTPDVVLRPPETALNFGNDIVGVGDVDRDGWADLAVSATGAPGGGRVYIYRGGPSGVDATAPYALRSAEASTLFGMSLGSHGDVDGDGAPDLVVGDAFFDREAGRVWVFRGAVGGVDPVRWRALDGAADGERFGQSL
ncbi:MAG: FG-GAP-like repeat-containing protein [Polyangiales bacterium]